jgi:peptidoglycan biosynthesis protein MviN/MurJ (putative lipid II flippase)
MGTIITLIGLFTTVAGNILFIPNFGYMACAWSFLASSLVMMLLCYVGGQKFDPIPYRWKAGLFYIVLGYLCIELGHKMGSAFTLPNLINENLGVLILLFFVMVSEFSWHGGGKIKLKH